MVDPACEPASPGPCPALRFFAVLGPDAIEAQGSGAVWKSGVVEATHAHASAKPPGVTPSGPATSSSSSHQPAELSAQPASQRVYDSTASHQRDDPRVERCAYHAISKRHIMPKASDTTPSEATTHIIHHHGLHLSPGQGLTRRDGGVLIWGNGRRLAAS